MYFLITGIKIILFCWCYDLTSGDSKEWKWSDYTVVRQYVRPDDPWAVDRCIESYFNDTQVMAFPEDCTRYQTCKWSDDKTTINVHIPDCFKCNPPECPEGKMIYHAEDNKCYPPDQLLPSENECGTKVPLEECSEEPLQNENVHRLGTSRFYIHHDPTQENWVNWHGAKELCTKLGLKLAKIENIQTEVYLGRQLERFLYKKRWADNWYWLDAKFDPKLHTYVWQDTLEPLAFSNFYYRPPRPKGYGGFFDIKGEYKTKVTDEHCLAQSLPLPFPKTKKGLVPYAFHTAWWERLCNSKKKGNVLCESVDPVCDEKNSTTSRSTATIAFSDYYYQEFWPIANRRFVVFWGAKSFKQAKALCEENNLQIYSPREGDTCLLTELKRQNLEVTTYSFWTDVRYRVNQQTYVYPNGEEVPLRFHNITTMRSSIIKETCVSYTWNYEKYPANVNFCHCNANSLVLSPENCINPIGVICQHPGFEDKKSMKCETGDITANPRKTWYEFDSKKLGLVRSSYKQPGNGGACPAGYQRVTINDTYWEPEEEYDFHTSSYQYDYLASYWMLPVDSTCYLSQVLYDAEAKTFTRNLKIGNCNKWLGFILCKSKDLDQSPVGETDISAETDPTVDESMTEATTETSAEKAVETSAETTTESAKEGSGEAAVPEGEAAAQTSVEAAKEGSGEEAKPASGEAAAIESSAERDQGGLGRSAGRFSKKSSKKYSKSFSDSYETVEESSENSVEKSFETKMETSAENSNESEEDD